MCIEIDFYMYLYKPLKSDPDCIAHYDAMHFGIKDRTGDPKERFSFIYNWRAKQRNYSTSWELEQRKTFSKSILISKADEQFFGSVISKSR